MWGLLYGAWVAFEIGILIVTRTRTANGESHDRGSLLLLWPVVTLSISVGTWYGNVHPPGLFRSSWQARMVSIFLLAVGLAIRWIAMVKLGRSFTASVVIQREQRIEKTGIFRFIRHPSYAGLLIIFTGLGLSTRSWVGCAIIIVPLPSRSSIVSISRRERSAMLSAKNTAAIAVPRNA